MLSMPQVFEQSLLLFHEYFVGKEGEGEFPAEVTPDNTKPYAVNAERRTNRRQGM